MFELKDKVCVVTGGASGIGWAISKLFSERGALVQILERNQESISNAEQNKEGGTGITHHICDVTKADEVAKVVENIVAKHQRIDVLINNAGIAHVGNIESTTEDDMDRVYGVNVKGVYLCMREVIPVMVKQGKGVILNMASIASSVGINDRFAYSMSKGAVLTMTYSVAKDYIDKGIRCNSLSPARVHTPFVDNFIKKNYPGQEQEMFDKLSATQPIGRMGRPEEVAKLALFICSDDADFITGTDFPIDGGFIKLQG